ncbi:MAG: M16 family metallopeptidase [Planctomycetota bacterium]|jgi:zinc protease
MRRALIALLLLCSALLAQEIDVGQRLPVDPGIDKMGTLPNGLQYWIRANRTPPGKVSLILHIRSGSLNESDEQRGVAHFLEHMAFNGSENFAPGEMVKAFEALGMRFGQHQNAFTSFDQTTYMMRLPDTKKETLKKVLLFFGDVAYRLSLLPDELDRERGVILEEARSRKSVGQRLRDKSIPLTVPGSRVAERMPIGIESVITGAPRERFVSYYRTWYRPGNAVMLVCGDIDVDEIEAMIRAEFRDWKPVTEPAATAKSGIRYDTGELRAAVVSDPELTQAQTGLACLEPLRPRATVGDYRARLVERIGTWIVNRRLRQMVQKGEAPFQSASVELGDFMRYASTVDLHATGEPEKWKEMLTAVIVEAKRARVHGFSETEFADAKTAIVASAEQAAQAEPTLDSFGRLMAMNGAVARGRKPMSRAQREEVTKKLLPTITRKEVHAVFGNAFTLDRGIVLATLPEKEGFDLPEAAVVLAVAREAAATEVEKAAEVERKKNLLEKDPAPAAVVAQTTDPDLAILTATLENGVRVHCRSMDLKKDRVWVRVRFVGGVLDETEKTAGLTLVGSLALQRRSAASSRHSSTDISNLLTGKKFGFGGGPAEGGLLFQLSGAPEDLEDGFRLLHLLLSDARLEQPALDRWKQQMRLMLPNLEQRVQFQAGHAVTDILSGSDPRFGVPTADHVDAMTRDDAQKWLSGILETAPIEAAIVGDMDRDRMLELARKYLGTLPKRPVVREGLAELRKVKQNPGPHVRTIEVDTITPQAVVQIGWRGPAFGHRKEGRVLLVGSQILATRLTRVIREERQLTYSIGCTAQPAAAFDGMGRLMVMFTADPGKAEDAAKLARQVVEDIVEKTPPTQEELVAVRKQIQNILDTQLEAPSFWVDVLSSLETRHRNIADLKTLAQEYGSITSEQIREVLQRYLTEERYYQVIARPAEKSK